MKLTEDQYMDVQNELLMLCSLMARLPLEEFLEDINRAETVGPIVDPTLYIQGREPLSQIKSLAEAASKVSQVYRDNLKSKETEHD